MMDMTACAPHSQINAFYFEVAVVAASQKYLSSFFSIFSSLLIRRIEMCLAAASSNQPTIR